MTWLPWLALIVCMLGLATAGAWAFSVRRWSGDMQALKGRLQAQRVQASLPARYDARELEGLPAPVQRYFRAVLRDGQPLITAATIEMAGRFNMSPTSEQWKPFSAHQHVALRRPGFVWDARISMLPGGRVNVVDSYTAGQGLLRASLMGLYTVAEVQGEGEIARGELMRWFAEAAWYPTALLPSQGVRWAAVDDHSAQATMSDGPLSLTLLFRFNDAGLIASFRAEARGSLEGDKMVMAPWEGTWSNYQARDGMWVPSTGEVAWMRPEGRKPYFFGTVTALTFEFAP